MATNQRHPTHLLAQLREVLQGRAVAAQAQQGPSAAKAGFGVGGIQLLGLAGSQVGLEGEQGMQRSVAAASVLGQHSTAAPPAPTASAPGTPLRCW